jgi:hypothetical protein
VSGRSEWKRSIHTYGVRIHRVLMIFTVLLIPLIFSNVEIEAVVAPPGRKLSGCRSSAAMQNFNSFFALMRRHFCTDMSFLRQCQSYIILIDVIEHAYPTYSPTTLPLCNGIVALAPQPRFRVLKTSMGTSRGRCATRFRQVSEHAQPCAR